MTDRPIAGSVQEECWSRYVQILQGHPAFGGTSQAAFMLREHRPDGQERWLQFTADDARNLADYLDLRTQKWKEAHP